MFTASWKRQWASLYSLSDKTPKVKPSVVAHVYNPCSGQAGAERHLRAAWAIEQDPISRNKRKCLFQLCLVKPNVEYLSVWNILLTL